MDAGREGHAFILSSDVALGGPLTQLPSSGRCWPGVFVSVPPDDLVWPACHGSDPFFAVAAAHGSPYVPYAQVLWEHLTQPPSPGRRMQQGGQHRGPHSPVALSVYSVVSPRGRSDWLAGGTVIYKGRTPNTSGLTHPISQKSPCSLTTDRESTFREPAPLLWNARLQEAVL